MHTDIMFLCTYTLLHVFKTFFLDFRFDIHNCDLKTYCFSTRCNIYISRLCYDISVHLSVCDGSALAHYS